MDAEQEIIGMLRGISASGDEDALFAARQEMYRFRADALARPNAVRVDFLRVKLRRRLAEIIEAARDESQADTRLPDNC